MPPWLCLARPPWVDSRTSAALKYVPSVADRHKKLVTSTVGDPSRLRRIKHRTDRPPLSGGSLAWRLARVAGDGRGRAEVGRGRTSSKTPNMARAQAPSCGQRSAYNRLGERTCPGPAEVTPSNVDSWTPIADYLELVRGIAEYNAWLCTHATASKVPTRRARAHRRLLLPQAEFLSRALGLPLDLHRTFTPSRLMPTCPTSSVATRACVIEVADSRAASRPSDQCRVDMVPHVRRLPPRKRTRRAPQPQRSRAPVPSQSVVGAQQARNHDDANRLRASSKNALSVRRLARTEARVRWVLMSCFVLRLHVGRYATTL